MIAIKDAILGIVGAGTLLSGLASGPVYGADAADLHQPPFTIDVETGALDENSHKAVTAWQNEKPVSAVAERSGGSKTVKASRGSFLMWAEENVSFAYSNNQVTWSNAYQRSGAVFPNNVTQNGTTRVFASSWNHRWQGSYTVGEGGADSLGGMQTCIT